MKQSRRHTLLRLLRFLRPHGLSLLLTALLLVLANLLVNLLVNAALGSVWTMMVRGGGYWGWFVPSLGKNLLTIVPKAILLYILYQALLPILRQMRIIPNQLGPKGLISFF